jgi:O-antigen ligase
MIELTQTAALSKLFERARLSRLADGLVVAVAISLPWSTSATSILLVAWLLVAVPALNPTAFCAVGLTPAGGLPILLWIFGATGMGWAPGSFAERLVGLAPYHKLLMIPLLLAQFGESERGMRVLKGFLISATALMALSWVHGLSDGRSWLPTMTQQDGVPVKDYVSQSEIFQLCAFALIFLALEYVQARWWGTALALSILALLFLANIATLATSRTTLIIMPVLALLLGVKRFGCKGLGGCLVATAIVGGMAWGFSPYLRHRVTGVASELKGYQTQNSETPSGARLEFWNKSLKSIAEAPVLGHGTGSIREVFRRAATGENGASSIISSNPHQQTLAIGIELGLVGIGVLLAVWIAHLALFSGQGFVAWSGFIVVVQNIIGSQFNSHIFDFTQGWLYVLGVGVAGGVVLRDRSAMPGTVGYADPFRNSLCRRAVVKAAIRRLRSWPERRISADGQ